MERGKRDRETQTPAANAASRKKGNTPGSQRGGREDEEWGGRGDDQRLAENGGYFSGTCL